jgi:hypothetical protein
MRVNEALGQIAEIHDHLARGEQYRGFHPFDVATSGLVGLLAAFGQSWIFLFINPLNARGPTAFAVYWLIVAAIAGGVGIAPAIATYIYREDEFAQRRTRRLAGQFLPCVVAGLCVTLAVIRGGWAAGHLLPGIWMVLFSLGVFAARPFLPRTIGWVGLFYLTAGALLLALARPASDFDNLGWCVGGTFAVGQAATAFVLYRNQERDTDA